jgi:hypothetical protein
MWLGLCLGIGPLACAGLLLCALVLVGHNLDRAWLKTRLVAQVEQHAGLHVDYAGLDVSLLDGVRARSLRILTPQALAAGSEVFVSVEGLELSAPLWSLPFERRVSRLHVDAIDVVVVRDEAGRNTWSELFPPRGEPDEKEAAPPLSRTLADLPQAALDHLEVGTIRLRHVELSETRPLRVVELGSIGLEGALQSGVSGLAGSALRAHAAPSLRLELREGALVRGADLELAFEARATDAESIALSARLALLDQDLAAGWPRSAELLGVRAALRFAAVPGLTTLRLAELRALDGGLDLAGTTRVFDAGPMRVAATGRAALHLGSWPPKGLPRASLPPPLSALALGSIDLDASARELSWHEGDGVFGAVEWQGSLRDLALDDGTISARSSAIALRGSGSFEGPEGRFRALVSGSLGTRTPELEAVLDSLTLTMNATTRREARAQPLAGTAVVTLGSARVVRGAGEVVELGGARLESQLKGDTASLAERAVAALEARFSLERLRAGTRGQRVQLDGLALGASLRDIAAEPSSPTGLSGSAELSLRAGALAAFERPRGARSERRALTLRDIDGGARLPLSLAEAHASLGVASLAAPRGSLSRLALAIEAREPLAWAPGGGGAPRATLRGSLAAARVGESQGAVRELRGSAQRDADRYELALDAALTSLVGRGQAIPGPLNATLRASGALGSGTLETSASLRGGTAAPALDASATAQLRGDDARLRYQATLAGERLRALLRWLLGAVPEAGPISVGASRLRASARGELGGVLRPGEGPLPEVAPEAVQSLRGQQAFEVSLGDVEYRTPDVSLSVPDVSFALESEHRARGAGEAKARLHVAALRYEGKGRAVGLERYQQKLAATFDRLPGQGVTALESTIELASATQSWLPGYPVRDLRCSADIQLDRQLSIALRGLDFDNPGGGSRLSASGALELRAEDSPAITGAQALVGREALSFDGRFEQVFEPLQRAGATARSSGSVTIPFRVESGGLLGYRLLATVEAEDLFFATHDGSLEIQRLNGVVPIVEEIALLPGGVVMGSSPRGSPLSDARFFDVHPFLAGDNYVTADSIRTGSLPAFGPLAANVRLERTGLSIDQLQVGFSGGQIVGQARFAYREGNPILRSRLNATGLRSGRSDDIFDANATIEFEPVALTLDGKLQIVRATSAHVLDMLDVLDPYRESTNANRVRSALALGYPKFVRFKLHDGTVDAKVELGGLAQLVRLDEIKAIPLGPVLQRYVAPKFEGLLPPRPPPSAPAAGAAQAPPAGPPAARGPSPVNSSKTATRDP